MAVSSTGVTQPAFIESVAESADRIAKLVIKVATASPTQIDFVYEIASTEVGITQAQQTTIRVKIETDCALNLPARLVSNFRFKNFNY